MLALLISSPSHGCKHRGDSSTVEGGWKLIEYTDLIEILNGLLADPQRYLLSNTALTLSGKRAFNFDHQYQACLLPSGGLSDIRYIVPASIAWDKF